MIHSYITKINSFGSFHTERETHTQTHLILSLNHSELILSPKTPLEHLTAMEASGDDAPEISQ